MMQLSSIILVIYVLFLCSIPAAAIPVDPIERALSKYTPYQAACPSIALVRPASGLSADEADFRSKRKAVADAALKNWLLKTNAGFGTGSLPTVS